MSRSLYVVAIGALLHDIGKVFDRANNIDEQTHSISGEEFIKQFTDDRNILDCIRFHHKNDINKSLLDDNSLAYIVYIADKIASSTDILTGEENSSMFDRNRPLESIFNLLNNGTGKASYLPAGISDNINYPDTNTPSDLSPAYHEIFKNIKKELKEIPLKEEYANSALELCETYLSYIPSSTHSGQICDISLFDHSKITAAIASCIYLYLEDCNKNSYRQDLFVQEEDFLDQKAFCLLSIDLSGIQSFIYTISSKGALKGLRSRSFYLEILMENTIDEILCACELTRANLLYSGGGHAYILLPNTSKALQKASSTLSNINSQLLKNFGSALYLAYGLEPCSANALMSRTDNGESYSSIFRSLSTQISSMKLRRYSADEIRYLNNETTDKEGRECSICGVSSKLIEREEGTICENCAAFADISNSLLKPNIVLAVLRKPPGSLYLRLFSAEGTDLFLCPMDEENAKKIIRSERDMIVRIYSKNAYRTGISLAKKLWMGDYAAKNDKGGLKTFAELEEESKGIKRIGVLRADIDNLGTAFVKGFIRESDLENKYRYVNISRTAALSRNLSIFFKYYINSLFEKPTFSFREKQGKRNAVIVYSGGDDMFVVGAWDEVLAAALDIRKAFYRYTGGALTLSAGFAVFDAKYPISRMAEETAELEERAKRFQSSKGHKNAISLFGLEMDGGTLRDRHTYSWDVFENKVLGEKYAAIQALFNAGGGYGSSLLYNILSILKQAEYDRINIARLAFLLARREPGVSAPKSLKEIYSNFTADLYRWALDEDDRQQLITAIMIYAYTMREEKEENGNG